MKLSRIINYPLGWFGLKLGRKPATRYLPVPADIARDTAFLEIYNKVRDHSIVDIEGSYALYCSVKYLIEKNIPGDLVECGVWKGGCCMLMAHAMLQAGITNRKIWLYDTFSGMTEPGEHDGEAEKEEWLQKRTGADKSDWCMATIEEVQANMKQTGYPVQQLEFVKGKVESTIPARLPGSVALLRLDTDWYTSTRHELQHLYPLLVKDGVLIIDDYGAWQGARKATDEYFGSSVLLSRINWTGRLLIKP